MHSQQYHKMWLNRMVGKRPKSERSYLRYLGTILPELEKCDSKLQKSTSKSTTRDYVNKIIELHVDDSNENVKSARVERLHRICSERGYLNVISIMDSKE